MGPSPNGTDLNTPANDFWTLEISYTPNTGPTLQSLYIAFLPNGSVDTIHTPAGHLENATNLLAPTITYLRSTTTTKFDFWQLINWLYVSLYWTMLADLGQAVPTTYPVNQLGAFNFSAPVDSLPTNNIFINTTLYEIYGSYLQNTVLPILQIPNQPIPPVTNGTEVTLPDMTFIKSYSCTRRQIKSTINFIISVVVADYALIIGGYTLAIFVAGSISKYRRREGNGLPLHRF